MEWIDVSKELPSKDMKVIVTTKTRYTEGNVLKIEFHYDKEKKPVWGCKNQIVTQWLKEN